MIILTVHNNRLEVFVISSIVQIIWLVLIIFLGLLIKHPRVKWFESFDKLNELIQEKEQKNKNVCTKENT